MPDASAHDSARLSLPTSGQDLSLQIRETATPEAFGTAECSWFEFTSRGDRVPGRLIRPGAARGPLPLIVLQHGANGSKESDYMEAAAPWVRGGAAIASIDLPLHGERRSAKLTDHLLATVHASFSSAKGDELDGRARQLWIEFVRQSLADLKHCLDAMMSLAEIDSGRVAYASFSLGSMLGALFCSLDPRPRAAALALGGGGFGPACVDPVRYVAGIAPRPLLMVNAKQDELFSKQATETLFDAARQPKAIEWFEAGHHALPGQAMKTMWLFLREHLEIEAGDVLPPAEPGGLSMG